MENRTLLKEQLRFALRSREIFKNKVLQFVRGQAFSRRKVVKDLYFLKVCACYYASQHKTSSLCDAVEARRHGSEKVRHFGGDSSDVDGGVCRFKRAFEQIVEP